MGEPITGANILLLISRFSWSLSTILGHHLGEANTKFLTDMSRRAEKMEQEGIHNYEQQVNYIKNRIEEKKDMSTI